jgi:signal transduction histidine kinase
LTRASRSGSLRLRLTALAALVITATILAGFPVLAITLVISVRANVTTTLSAYADSVARSGTDGTWPDPLAPAAADSSMWAQVVDESSGKVLASTANVVGLPALYSLPAGSTNPEAIATNRGDEQVVAERYVSGRTPVVVFAGGSNRVLTIVTSDIQGHLLFALPVVVLCALAASWLLIGRALRPVERMRAEAAEITGSDLHRRIPEPGGDDEIGRLARTLNSMLDRIEQSSAKQRRFVSDASHELRTPLAAVRTSLEVGLAHPDQAPWPELAERAVTETTRLQRLVDALLLQARADAGALVLQREPVDLAALARNEAAAPARIPVELRAEGAVVVLGDADQLTRLIRNLLDNADRHAATHVRLTVAAQDGDSALIEVADDGPGIPAEDRERIFDRFVRLQTSRARRPGSPAGTGLGLSIARDIVAAHGGTVTVTDSRPEPPEGAGRGATFTVRIPLHQPGRGAHPA